MVAAITTALIVFVVGSLASGTAFTMLRANSAIRRALLAGGVGFLTSALASAALLVTTRAALSMSSHDIDRVLTPGVLCTFIAPIVGVLAAKHVRSKLQKRAVDITVDG